MKKIILFVATISFAITLNAQTYKETFDSNSLEWTECGTKNALGTAVIDKGFMTLKSKGEKKGLSVMTSVMAGSATTVGENTFFETHCYAPIDVQKPFSIKTKVNVKSLGIDKNVGLIFNYRDGGNFYVFSFSDESVMFIRYENYSVVGEVMQNLKLDGKRKADMEWELISSGDKLTFKVDGTSLLNIRYMPLSYSGVGFYAYGNQELIIDEIEFIQ